MTRTVTFPQRLGRGDEIVAASAPPRNRVDSVDMLRGLVMLIMALDHVRDFFSTEQLGASPIGDRTYPALFLTRWITHYCAPTFVFLAGTGAFLAGSRGKSRSQLSWFLLTRGLWLVFLEVTVVRCSWCFNLDMLGSNGAGVIWAIGWSMVALSALVYLPLSAIAAFGVVMIAYHNLFDDFLVDPSHPFGWLWAILHSGQQMKIVIPSGSWLPTWEIPPPGPPGPFQPPPNTLFFGPGYPLIPWIGVMASGYAFGALFRLDPEKKRRSQLFGLGIMLTLTFVALRFSNLYGNLEKWKQHPEPHVTVFSFIDTHKYPPSVLYLLMTLGPAITALAVFERLRGPVANFLVVFGRVPLFYYLLHIPLIHILLIAFTYARYHSLPKWLVDWPGSMPPEEGYPLWAVYLIWVGVVLLLYPLCLWFGGVKRRHRDSWLLSYL